MSVYECKVHGVPLERHTGNLQCFLDRITELQAELAQAQQQLELTQAIADGFSSALMKTEQQLSDALGEVDRIKKGIKLDYRAAQKHFGRDAWGEFCIRTLTGEPTNEH